MDTGGVPDPLAHTGEAEVARDPLLGRNIGGKFVLEKQLGAGAMGAVYRARQTALEKIVAIKVMHGELARDPMFAARFHREAKAASRLDHPNSIAILDYGEDTDGLLYIAMEFLNGRDLAHLIEQEWPMEPARIVDLMSQALGAIGVAHDLGITHRDLKPENIMVLRRTTDEGVDIDVVKVCDFGIAKLVEADDAPASVAAPGRGKLTTAGLVIGTPAYMSPEQGRGELIDGRSDIYSMGVILFQLLTGQLPYDSPSAIGLVVKHQTEPVPVPSTVRPGVDSQLEAVCVKALQKAPGDRFQTARDLRAALRVAIDAAPPSRLSITTGPRLVVPSSDPRLPHEAAVTARTELQLAASPTGPAIAMTGAPSVLATGAIDASTGGAKRGRWPLVVGGVVVAAALAVVGVRMKTSAVVSSDLPAQAGPTATVVAAAGINGAGTPETPPEKTPFVDTTDRGARAAAVVADPSHATGPADHVQTHKGAPTTPTRGVLPDTAHAQIARNVGPIPPVPAEPPRPPEPPPAPAPAPEPPPVAVVAPPPPAPAAPPAPAFNVATAGVDVGGATNTQQIGAARVNAAMSRVKGTVNQCYLRALPALTGSLEGAGTLHLETDDNGTITSATLKGPVRGAVASCIESSARGQKIDGVDTGSASADVPLVFRAK